MKPNISILIRTFNSGKTLDQVISRMNLAPADEIIIVDSGSMDNTLEIATKHRAKIINAPPPFNYSKSLNLGFRAAKNPWVLVLSSHCIPLVDDFLEIHRQAVAGFPDDVVVGYAPGSIDGRSAPHIANDSVTYFVKDDYERVYAVCGNANAIYRHSAWVTVQFDETILTSEDIVWLLDITSGCKRFAYIPQARAINKNQGSLRYMFMKGHRDARACRLPGEPPMKIRHLLGGYKIMLLRRIRNEIDWGNCLRGCAHVTGQYFASYRSPTNAVDDTTNQAANRKIPPSR